MKNIKLVDESVLLTENIDKSARTKYTLFGIEQGNRTVLLNLNLVNNYFRELYEYKKIEGYEDLGEGKQEVNIEGYKADYYIPE